MGDRRVGGWEKRGYCHPFSSLGSISSYCYLSSEVPAWTRQPDFWLRLYRFLPVILSSYHSCFFLLVLILELPHRTMFANSSSTVISSTYRLPSNQPHDGILISWIGPEAQENGVSHTGAKNKLWKNKILMPSIIKTCFIIPDAFISFTTKKWSLFQHSPNMEFSVWSRGPPPLSRNLMWLSFHD